ncbi:WD40-repeat-containing domain [Pseudocohnilembus persalinus]|uniref:WD40-repeat-containing domain n=1 Tax=Pseudocohnilembus persalinus TaxID=266149 RepID=A0A0V0R249_PSEPJ|nr:WD40-repeat-containing domain [Pseudocohnilembus persalinus]|eukprot:KRX08612.1 WD40-repeat-containing domain [Pseudocohnilembus persalinus]
MNELTNLENIIKYQKQEILKLTSEKTFTLNQEEKISNKNNLKQNGLSHEQHQKQNQISDEEIYSQNDLKVQNIDKQQLKKQNNQSENESDSILKNQTVLKKKRKFNAHINQLNSNSDDIQNYNSSDNNQEDENNDDNNNEANISDQQENSSSYDEQSYDFKIKVLKEALKNYNLKKTAEKYNISQFKLRTWRKNFENDNPEIKNLSLQFTEYWEQKKNQYNDDEKKRIVKLSCYAGFKTKVANEFGVNLQTIKRWQERFGMLEFTIDETEQQDLEIEKNTLDPFFQRKENNIFDPTKNKTIEVVKTRKNSDEDSESVQKQYSLQKEELTKKQKIEKMNTKEQERFLEMRQIAQEIKEEADIEGELCTCMHVYYFNQFEEQRYQSYYNYCIFAAFRNQILCFFRRKPNQQIKNYQESDQFFLYSNFRTDKEEITAIKVVNNQLVVSSYRSIEIWDWQKKTLEGQKKYNFDILDFEIIKKHWVSLILVQKNNNYLEALNYKTLETQFTLNLKVQDLLTDEFNKQLTSICLLDEKNPNHEKLKIAIGIQNQLILFQLGGELLGTLKIGEKKNWIKHIKRFSSSVFVITTAYNEIMTINSKKPEIIKKKTLQFEPIDLKVQHTKQEQIILIAKSDGILIKQKPTLETLKEINFSNGKML